MADEEEEEENPLWRWGCLSVFVLTGSWIGIWWVTNSLEAG